MPCPKCGGKVEQQTLGGGPDINKAWCVRTKMCGWKGKAWEAVNLCTHELFSRGRWPVNTKNVRYRCLNCNEEAVLSDTQLLHSELSGEQMAREVINSRLLNQCDGCSRGLPVIDGVHRGKGYDMIACTKDRYLNGSN